MSQWAPEVEFRLDAGNLPSDALAGLIANTADTTKRAENAILYDVVQAVERNYRDLPVGILFERDSLGFTFQIWDYNRSAMKYVPRPQFSADAAVSEVLASLEDIGYLPGSPDGSRGAAPSARRVASLSQAIIGIRSLPDEQARHLAAKTLLLGSYDFDRSGSIDQAREVDALSCQVWTALDGTFPDVLDRFGFVDQTVRYSGSIFFSISERVRVPAGRRGQACMDGQPPPPTAEEEVVSVVSEVPLPEPVTAFVANDAAARVVSEAGARERGSADWAEAVRRVLLEEFDGDGSGALDRSGEVNAVPCVVWQAIWSTHVDFVADLGLDGQAAFAGDSIGVHIEQRDFARSRTETCLWETGSTAPTRIRRTRAGTTGRPSARFSPVNALASIGSFPVEERQRAGRTILLSAYDLDRSGYIDEAAELDAISCETWTSLDGAFADFAAEYGFVADTVDVRHFRGSLVFNISRRLKEPAIQRFLACQTGLPPPATDPATVPAADTTIDLPVSLRQFMNAQTAARVALDTDGLEPGSADWAAAVQAVLLEKYDLDSSGMIDLAEEVEQIACVVWNTIQTTFAAPLSVLGLHAGGGLYLGHVIGIAVEQRDAVSATLGDCP